MSYAESYYGAMTAADLINTEILKANSARLVCKSTVEEDEGKTVIVNDGTNAYTKTFGSDLTCIFDIPGRQSYTITVKNSAGVTEFTGSADLNWGDYKVVEVGLNNQTWQGFQNIVNAGLGQKYVNVGDEMEVTLTTGETVIFRVANVEAKKLIWEARYALAATRQMNSSQTNSGGWNSCAMRSWLNSTFYNSLPDDLRGLIATHETKASVGSQSSSLQTASDKIWLPREYEVFGSTTYAASSEHTAGGAEQFAIYADASNRIKTLGKTGATSVWWLASPIVGNSSYFCYVSTSGSANGNYASNTCGVVPCFEISAS